MSDFLEAVNGAPLPDDVAFTSIYSCTDEYIQPYDTSIIPGAKNIGLCDGFVGHFEFFYNPEIYLVMHEALTEPAPKDALDEPGDAPGETVETAPGTDLEESVDPSDGADAEAPGPNAGCSTGGSSNGGSAWLVLGALGLAVGRRRRD